MPETPPFEGFRPEAITFLADLAANNDRAWFTPRKAEYERLLKVPLQALCVALAERFTARGLPLTADPARSPFRIYRDVRFGKDKSPYKTAASARFMAPVGDRAPTSTWSPGRSTRAAGCTARSQPCSPRGGASWTRIPPPSTPPSRTRGSWPPTARSTATG